MYEIPFLDRMFIVSWLVVAGMVVLSNLSQDGKVKALVVDRRLFKVDGAFALGSAVVCMLVATIYGMWW